VHQSPQSKAWCDSDVKTGQKFVLQTVNGDRAATPDFDIPQKFFAAKRFAEPTNHAFA